MRDDNEAPVGKGNPYLTHPFDGQGVFFDKEEIKNQIKNGFDAYHFPTITGSAVSYIFKGTDDYEQILDKAWLFAMTQSKTAKQLNPFFHSTTSHVFSGAPIRAPFDYAVKFDEKKFTVGVDDKKLLVTYNNVLAGAEIEYYLEKFKKLLDSRRNPKQPEKEYQIEYQKSLNDERNRLVGGFTFWNINRNGEIINNATKAKISRNEIELFQQSAKIENAKTNIPSNIDGVHLPYKYKTEINGVKISRQDFLNVDFTDNELSNFNQLQKITVKAYLEGMAIAFDGDTNFNTAASNITQYQENTGILLGQLNAKLSAATTGIKAIVKEVMAKGLGAGVILGSNPYFRKLTPQQKINTIKALVIYQYNNNQLMTMRGGVMVQNSGKGFDTLDIKFNPDKANPILDILLNAYSKKFRNEKINFDKIYSIWDPGFGQAKDRINNTDKEKELWDLSRGKVTSGTPQIPQAWLKIYGSYIKKHNIKIDTVPANNPIIKPQGGTKKPTKSLTPSR